MNKVYEIEEMTEFSDWLGTLKDRVAKFKIVNRIERMELGALGDCEPCGGGLFEAREHFGAGYRFYWFRYGKKIIVVTSGGDKSTQRRDIKRAKELMNAFKEAHR